MILYTLRYSNDTWNVQKAHVAKLTTSCFSRDTTYTKELGKQGCWIETLRKFNINSPECYTSETHTLYILIFQTHGGVYIFIFRISIYFCFAKETFYSSSKKIVIKFYNPCVLVRFFFCTYFYIWKSHFLGHDEMATRKTGK